MEKQKDIPLFETKLRWLHKLAAVLQIALGVFVIVKFVPTFTRAHWGEALFFCLFAILLIVQAIRVAKTFHLYADRLVIRRPFFFSTKTDVIFKVAELREVIFCRIKGRYGGPHLIVKTRSVHESWRINIGEQARENFTAQLTQLGVKVSLENM